MMKEWLTWIEQGAWSKEGLPYDFPTQRPFYDLPLFRPYLDDFLLQHGNWSPPTYNGKKWAVCITMDLDSFFLAKEKLRRIWWAVRRRQLKTLLGALYRLLRKRPEVDLAEYLKTFSDYRIKATFFVPFYLGNNQDPRDPLYTLNDVISYQGKKIRIKHLIRFLWDEGHEVGLHASIPSALDPKRLYEEKRGLEQEIGITIKSVRQHWLMFDVKKSPEFQKKAGFSYDSTFGFNRIPGFRAGTAYPFRFHKDSILEVPLLLQEGALLKGISSGSLGLSLDKAILLGRTLLQRVAEVGGVAVILVHPYKSNTVEGLERRRWLEAMIEAAIKRDALFMTISEAGSYWENKYESSWSNAINDLLASLSPERRYVWRFRCYWA